MNRSRGYSRSQQSCFVCIFAPAAANIAWRFVEVCPCLILCPLRNTVCGFGNAAGYCRESVATRRDGVSNRVLEIGTFEKGYDCLRQGVLTAFVEAIGWANLIQRMGQVVVKISLSFLFQLSVRQSATAHCSRKRDLRHEPTQEYSCCRCLRAFNSFRMVVRYVGRATYRIPSV